MSADRSPSREGPDLRDPSLGSPAAVLGGTVAPALIASWTDEGDRVDGDSTLVAVGLPVALAVIMVGIGLTLTRQDFAREAGRPRGMVIGTVGQVLAMPLVGFAVAALLGLDPAIAVGLVIVATVPGGTTSNVVCFVGRGNVALSIVLTVTASLVTILTIPFVVDLAVAAFDAGADEAMALPVGRTIGQLVAIVLVPVALGMLVRARRPQVAAQVERAVSAFGAVVLVVLVIGIAAGVGGDIPSLLVQAGPAAILLNVAGIGLGLVLGRAGGLPARDRLTIAVELGIKNATLAILVATLLSDDPALTVPAAVYGILMYLSAGILVITGRRSMAVDDPSEPVAGPATGSR